MTNLNALVIKASNGDIKRIVRTYETHSRAEQDQQLLDAQSMPDGEYTDIIEVDHIDS
jgi:hypothetical protein